MMKSTTAILSTIVATATAVACWHAMHTAPQTAQEIVAPQPLRVTIAHAEPTAPASAEIPLSAPPPTPTPNAPHKTAEPLAARDTNVASISRSVAEPIYRSAPAPNVAPTPPTAASSAPVITSYPSDDEANGYAALQLAQTMQGRERINMVREGISLIARTNVAHAIEMANSLTAEHDHAVAVGTIIRVVNEANPSEAADIFFHQVPPDTAYALIQYPRTAETMRDVVRTQLREDPQAAVEWAQSLDQQMAARQNLNQTELSSTYAFEKSLPKNAAYSSVEAINLVAKEWARTDPEAASAWAQTAADPAARDSIRGQIDAINQENFSAIIKERSDKR